jgi:hypothetical protein
MTGTEQPTFAITAARKFLVAAALMTLSSAPAWAGNYAQCILDAMPGVANAQAAFAVNRTCLSESPAGYDGVLKGSGRGLFAFKDSEACIIKRSKDTAQPNAALMIATACRCLYDEPIQRGESCAAPPFQPAAAPAAPAAPAPVPKTYPPEVQAHYRAVFAAHPDALELYDSADFKAWLSTQNDAMKQSLQAGSTVDVIAVFSAYKAARGRR